MIKQPKYFARLSFGYMDLFPQGGVGAECGVASGENAIDLLHMTKPKKFHLVDPWDHEKPLGPYGDPRNLFRGDRQLFHEYGQGYENLIRKVFRDEIKSKQIEVHRTEAKPWLDSLPENHLDWIYIDTSHFFEETFETLESSIRVLKKGGVLGMHDFNPAFYQWDVLTQTLHFINTGNLQCVGMAPPADAATIFLVKKK